MNTLLRSPQQEVKVMAKKGRTEEITGSKVLRRFTKIGIYKIEITNGALYVDINGKEQWTYERIARLTGRSISGVRRDLTQLEKGGEDISKKIKEGLSHYRGCVYKYREGNIAIPNPELAIAYIRLFKPKLADCLLKEEYPVEEEYEELPPLILEREVQAFKTNLQIQETKEGILDNIHELEKVIFDMKSKLLDNSPTFVGEQRRQLNDLLKL